MFAICHRYIADPYQYGARLQLGFYDIDFFAQYNFNSLFAKNKGPALTPFSFGFTF